MNNSEITELIQLELQKAVKKHPVWPADIIHAIAILVEEAGEALKAALEFVYEDGKPDALIKELLHTGAMVYRCLTNINNN